MTKHGWAPATHQVFTRGEGLTIEVTYFTSLESASEFYWEKLLDGTAYCMLPLKVLCALDKAGPDLVINLEGNQK